MSETADRDAAPAIVDLGGGVVMTAAQDALAAALAAAQGAVRSAEKNAKNTHLRSKYADLESVICAVRPAFESAGLAVSMHPIADGGAAGVRYVLSHSSGQWRSGVLMHRTGGKGLSPAQQDGVCISYARRYCLMSLAQCSAGDDVDGHAPGNDARGRPEHTTAPAPPPRPPVMVDTKSGQWKIFQASLSKRSLTYEQVAAWCEAQGRPRPSRMTERQFLNLVGWIAKGGDARIRAAMPEAETPPADTDTDTDTAGGES